ncbi:MAG: amino acid synthesis family protein [Pseudomonadota bacterium]
MTMRKTLFIKERVLAEAGKAAEVPVTRVAALAVLDNPFAGRFEQDLEALFDMGMQFGEALAATAVAMLERPAKAYGKAAIVGVNGDLEHAAALLHPKLGKPMRAACGGGEALIPSVTKVAAAGTAIDVPLAHKDEVWSFDELDTMTLMVGDAPRPNEILAILAYSDGGRPAPRVGKGRATV